MQILPPPAPPVAREHLQDLCLAQPRTVGRCCTWCMPCPGSIVTLLTWTGGTDRCLVSFPMCHRAFWAVSSFRLCSPHAAASLAPLLPCSALQPCWGTYFLLPLIPPGSLKYREVPGWGAWDAGCWHHADPPSKSWCNSGRPERPCGGFCFWVLDHFFQYCVWKERIVEYLELEGTFKGRVVHPPAMSRDIFN